MNGVEKIIEDTAVELLRKASTSFPHKYVEAFEKELAKMDGSIGKAQLRNIIQNISLARKDTKPMCQDTGIITFIVEIGDEFPLRSNIKKILTKATERATLEVPLRPNAVDMFQGNTGNNVGLTGIVPFFYIDFIEGDQLNLTAFPKGGGSSNVANFRMIKPGLGIKGVKEFVLEAVAEAGSLGCPPYFIGVGIGGGEDLCMFLAKKALLNPFRHRSKNPKIAEIEEELLEKINRLGIGVMGLGEGVTALDIHIIMAARHPASLPVGIVFSCWALRHASATIKKSGQVEML
jgi:fumarate hydratase subunit alpha